MNSRESLKQKMEEICLDAIDRCNKRLAKNDPPVSSKELKDIVIVVRESWYLLNFEYIAELTKGIDLMGDEEENEDSDDDDDMLGPPEFNDEQ